MNVEKQNEIYRRNLQLLSSCTDFKIECWNDLVMLHFMNVKDELEFNGYGWDAYPQNYEIEKSFQFTFFGFFGKRTLSSIRFEDRTLLFKDSVALTNQYSMSSLSNVMIELTENFQHKKQEKNRYKNFVFEGGKLYVGHRAFGGRTDEEVNIDKVSELLNKYVTIL